MSLDRVVDLLAGRLAAALGPGTRVDDVAPVEVADIPCVVVTVTDAVTTLSGVGRVPRGTRLGALLVSVAVDLADPVVDLGGGETLTLLSDDRRTLTLPNGPLVAADGTSSLPLGADDVTADDGAPFTVVTGAPTGRQVQADADAGTLRFGSALQASGTLTVAYHLGQWDVVTSRAQGDAGFDVTAPTAAAVRTLSRALTSAASQGFSDDSSTIRLVPRVWGPVVPVDLAGDPVRSQRITFGLDAEVVDPVLTTGGGVISTIAVQGAFAPLVPGGLQDPIEPFDVTRGAPT